MFESLNRIARAIALSGLLATAIFAQQFRGSVSGPLTRKAPSSQEPESRRPKLEALMGIYANDHQRRQPRYS